MSLRGYTLMEIAIVLAVLGLLLGASLVPLQVRYEREDRKEVERNLQEATDAVVGYAIANRTIARSVSDADDISHDLPAGRPYLPCPDITGDGLENRTSITVSPVATIAITSAVMTSEGVCTQIKGLLPWRTLGLRADRDPWGRRFGYRVDLAFSSEILGFDETFRADILDPRISLTLNAGVSVYQPRPHRDDSGALVCAEYTTVSLCPQLVDNMPNLLAGVVTTMAVTLGAREIPAYVNTNHSDDPEGILDGAAFLIYSHGKNGFGGIVADNNNCLGFGASGADDLGELGERANGFYRPAHPMRNPPFSCEAVDRSLFLSLTENLFFFAPENEITGADDIVVWTSPNALIGALLQAGELPIARAGFLPE